jgi:hypothetical protein
MHYETKSTMTYVLEGLLCCCDNRIMDPKGLLLLENYGLVYPMVRTL